MLSDYKYTYVCVLAVDINYVKKTLRGSKSSREQVGEEQADEMGFRFFRSRRVKEKGLFHGVFF